MRLFEVSDMYPELVQVGSPKKNVMVTSHEIDKSLSIFLFAKYSTINTSLEAN